MKITPQAKEIVSQSILRLRENNTRIYKCLAELTDEEVEKSFIIKNWKREYKEICSYHSPNGIERMFDCRPFDSQLRAYVYTDDSDSHILEIDIHGE